MSVGKVLWFSLWKGYGFISTSAGNLFVRCEDVEGYGQNLRKGDIVEFDIADDPKGPKAINVVTKSRQPRTSGDESKAIKSKLEKSFHKIQNTDGVGASQKVSDLQRAVLPVGGKVIRNVDYLAQALQAKQEKNYVKARELFERAIEQGGNLQVFYSYAAMEKERKRYDSARRVFQRGIERFPHRGKLYEDYGNLEKLTGQLDRAAQMFREGLKADPKHRLLHRYLAQVLLELGSPEHLAEAERHYEEAKRLGASNQVAEQEYALVKVLRGPFRGKMTRSFLEQAGFSIKRINQHPQGTYAVDFIAESMRPEYVESYDLSGQIYIRCLYKNNPTIEDVDALIDDFQGAKGLNQVNRDVLLFVIQSAASVRNYLYKLLESAGKNPTVVPIEETQLKASNSEAILKQILDEWLYRRNLYDERFPVSGRRFFGRENELLALIRSIDTGSPVGLFGLRKVGKTSLLQKLRDKRSQDIVIYLDLQSVPEGIRECSYLYWDLAQQLSKEVKNKYPAISQLIKFTLAGKHRSYTSIIHHSTIAVRFDADLRMVRDALTESPETSRVKVVVLLDELETMLPSPFSEGFKGYTTFFAYLRGMAQQDGFVISIVTGANPAICDEPQWEGRDNPVFKFYQEIFLPPLERRECHEMIRKLGRGMGITYTREGLDRIYMETGGHPFITRQLCSRIVKHFPERPLNIDEEKVNVGVEEFLFHDSDTFREILSRLDRDFPEEKELLFYIAGGTNTETQLSKLCKSSPQEGLKHLIGYQLVERQGKAYQYKMALLLKWIHRNWLDKEN